MKCYNKSIEIKNDYAEAYNNLGVVFQKLYNLNEAIINYKKSLIYKSNFSEAHNNLGSAYFKLGKFEEAIEEFNHSIKIKDDYFEAYTNLGNTLSELGKHEEAIVNYEHAISINRDYVEAHSNKGSALSKLYKYEEAIKSHKEALKINPKSAEAYNLFGNTFSDMQNFDEAINNYKKAQELDSEYNEAYLNEGIARLSMCQFQEGWKKYEYRFDKYSSTRLDIGGVNSMIYKSEKCWDGKYLDGTLLIWSEQGIGDHIFFGSMIGELQQFAKNIIFKVDKRLIHLFKRFFDKINFRNIKVESTEIKKSESFDKHIASGSLAQYLRKNEESFKNSPKKYLIPSLSNEKKFKEKFSNNKNLKIGLSWKTLNKKQHNRNVDLEDLIPILLIPNCDFFNLQFGNFDNEIKNFNLKNSVNIKKIEGVDNYHDIETLAAVINNLDLVITIQNSTAHLSSALGANTWIMLPKNARWHWPINKNKSLWYPSAKLFRQKKIDDWNFVVNSIGIDLKKIIN